MEIFEILEIVFKSISYSIITSSYLLSESVDKNFLVFFIFYQIHFFINLDIIKMIETEIIEIILFILSYFSIICRFFMKYMLNIGLVIIIRYIIIIKFIIFLFIFVFLFFFIFFLFSSNLSCTRSAKFNFVRIFIIFLCFHILKRFYYSTSRSCTWPGTAWPGICPSC